jgi:uncharacterized membrane protein
MAEQTLPGGDLMERGISETRRRFLSDESQKWVEQGIVSSEQRDGIMSCYFVARNLPTVVLSLGVAMIGIGVLLFIAANWQGIPAWCKIFLIVGLYIASVASAYLMETKGRRIASDLLMFLSGFLLLGGLALIGQIFHMAGGIDNLLGVWLLVYAPTFLVVRNLSVYILYEIVAIVYMNIIFEGYSDVFSYSYGDKYHIQFSPGPLWAHAVTALLAGVAWRLWNEGRKTARALFDSKIKYFFVGDSTRRIFLSNFMLVNWFTWMCVINSTGSSALPYVFGVLAIGVVISVMARRLDARDLDWQGLLFVGAAGMSLTFSFVWDNYSSKHLTVAAIVSSLALGAYLIYRIIKRRRGGGFAAFLFCALLVRWYIDLFFSFMSRSLFFIGGGVLLLLVAFAHRKWNKLSAREQTVNVRGGGDDDANKTL